MNTSERIMRALHAADAYGNQRPIVMLTAYDFISAGIAEEAGVDVILVGDSAGTTVLGYETTRDVTVDEMLMLTRAARRGAPNTCLIGDLPFGSYESDNETAVAIARRFVEAGADMVKLEGARQMTDRLRAIADAGIAAVGHVGLLPQGARSADELRARGRSSAEAAQIVDDAVQLDAAGAALIVVEAVPAMVADEIRQRIRVPLIGIGAGGRLGGQVLVYPDMLGLLHGKVPKFVRRYANLRADWADAVRAWAEDVRAGTFPSAAEEYGMPEEERSAFQALLNEKSPRHPGSADPVRG